MYQQSMSRYLPGCIVFVLDHSGSMADTYLNAQEPKEKLGLPGQGLKGSKAEQLTHVLNDVLQTLVLRSTKENGIYDHSHIAVLGYTTDWTAKPLVNSALGAWAGTAPVPLSQLAANARRVEREKLEVNPFGESIRRQISRYAWVDPVAKAGTPMCAALNETRKILEPWVVANPRSFPPIVIHITDGESTDGDPREAAKKLCTLATEDGPVLLFNAHLSSDDSVPALFPDTEARLHDNKFARMLFEMSSTLTPTMVKHASELNMGVTEQSRGFAFNSDFHMLERLLEIGTRTDLR